MINHSCADLSVDFRDNIQGVPLRKPKILSIPVEGNSLFLCDNVISLELSDYFTEKIPKVNPQIKKLSEHPTFFATLLHIYKGYALAWK